MLLYNFVFTFSYFSQTYILKLLTRILIEVLCQLLVTTLEILLQLFLIKVYYRLRGVHGLLKLINYILVVGQQMQQIALSTSAVDLFTKVRSF